MKLVPEIPQYSLGKILLVWAAAAVPMGVLGWIVAPALSRGSDNPGMIRVGVLTIGLIWQFILVMILLYREAGDLHWSTIRERLWLQAPRSSRTGATDRRLWEMGLGGEWDPLRLLSLAPAMGLHWRSHRRRLPVCLPHQTISECMVRDHCPFRAECALRLPAIRACSWPGLRRAGTIGPKGAD